MLGLPIRYLQGSGALWLAVLAGCGARTTTLYPDSDSVAVDASSGGVSGKTSGAGSATGSPAGGTTGSGATGAGATGSASSGKGGSSPGGKGGSPAAGATGGTAGTASGGAASSGTAGSASGGAPSGGTAGSASGGAAGSASGGTAGTGPDTIGTCSDYCRIQMQGACPNHIPVDQCVESCVSEVGDRGGLCEKVGNTLLGCLMTAYQNSANCEGYTNLALAKCSSLISAYESCEGPDIPPTPTPGPVPVSCSSSGSGNAKSCSITAKCSDGSYYTVGCQQLNAAESSCVCGATSASGVNSGASFTLNEGVTFACDDTLTACGYPQLGAK